MMVSAAVFASLLLNVLTTFTGAQRGFLFTVPAVLQQGTSEKGCVTFEGLSYLNVTISLKTGRTTVLTKSESLQDSGCIDLVISTDDVAPGEYMLVVTGSHDASGYSRTERATVKVEPSKAIVFIQTDKPVYNPGEEVKIRILAVGADLKPRLEPMSEIFIEDPNGVRMMQWLDEQVEKYQGIVDLKMPLSMEPVQGMWKISVRPGVRGALEKASFKVEEYVLPQYEIWIKPPSYVIINAKEVEGEVCAMYTYGEPVRGVLSIRVCREFTYYVRRGNSWQAYREAPICVQEKRPITGCQTFKFDVTSLKIDMHKGNHGDRQVVLNAEVLENATGVTLNRTVKLHVTRDLYQLDFEPYSSDTFKPGMPYHGNVKVSHPDGTPAPGETVKIAFENYRTNKKFSKSFVSNSQGHVIFTLPPLQDADSTIFIKASMPARTSSPGQGYRHLIFHNVRRLEPFAPKGDHSIKQWFSPTKSSLQIMPVERVAACGDAVTLNITHTAEESSDITFFYQMMSRGNLLKTGKHRHSSIDSIKLFTEDGSFDEESIHSSLYFVPRRLEMNPSHSLKRSIVSLPLTINVTKDMSPEVKLIVYYIRNGWETVADSLSLKVECTQNKVELEFAETSRYPGEKASISLRAAPGSVCSVGAVDKSVNLLGGKNTLTVSQVMSSLAQFELNEQSIPGEDKYCEDQVVAMEGPAERLGGRPSWLDPEQERYYSKYYDSMHAFKVDGVAVLSDLAINMRPCVMYKPPIVYNMPRSREQKRQQNREKKKTTVVSRADSTTVTTSAPKAATSAPKAKAPKKKKNLDVRTFFPETWLWDLHLVGASGAVTLTEKLPHTVTEWTASSFCTHKEKGLGVSSVTAIKGFQPFFLTLTLPVSMVRGEVLKLPVTVFNYLTECLVVKMTVQSSTNYTVVGQSESEHCVCGQEMGIAHFSIRFTELGDVPIKVRAESVDNNGVCDSALFMSDQIGERDAVERPLLVEAEGREEEFTESAYVCPPQGESVTQTVTLALPEQYVAGTPRATVSVIGDIMGMTLSGLDKLVRLPMGCGEQNMILFAPNIYVMQYLNSTDQMTEEIQKKTTGYMQTGYQRELTYRHADGSYSAFGNRDASGSTWLTAYVLKSFAQAKQFIFIDEKDLKISVDWLMTKQTDRGCFLKVGTVHHKDMKGGVNGGASLTAFVLVALLEAKSHLNLENVDEAIDQAFHCVELQSIPDTYTLSLLAYSYSLSGRNTTHSQQVRQQMETRAIKEDDLTHWSRETRDADADSVEDWKVRPVRKTLDIEMTAYMLMSVIARGGDNRLVEGIPLVKWLSTQRNSNGGFSSTQDTVVALQGLAKYAALVYQGESDLTILASSSDDYELFRVSDTNRLLLQTKPFTLPATVNFVVNGSGCALIQTTLKYNMANISQVQPSFHLSVATNQHANCKVRTMDICAKYEGEDGASNMAVIEVKMVSGWIPGSSSIEKLLNEAGLNLKKYEIDKNKVNFYFDELTAVLTCFRFMIEQHLEVEGAKPGKAEVYDYYDNTADMRVTEAYEIKPICGAKEELPFISQEQNDESIAMDPSLIEQELCPVCVDSVPENIVEEMCEKSHAYKAVLMSHEKYSIKLMVDYYQYRTSLRLHTHSVLPENCTCSHLTFSKNGKILILSPAEAEIDASVPTRASLTLGSDSKIYAIPSSGEGCKEIVRKLRQAIKTGVCRE